MNAQLPLDEHDMLPLREAFNRTTLQQQGYTFEQAQSSPLIARCLVNQAEAIVKERKA